jgi:hypothetical protein
MMIIEVNQYSYERILFFTLCCFLLLCTNRIEDAQSTPIKETSSSKVAIDPTPQRDTFRNQYSKSKSQQSSIWPFFESALGHLSQSFSTQRSYANLGYDKLWSAYISAQRSKFSSQKASYDSNRLSFNWLTKHFSLKEPTKNLSLEQFILIRKFATGGFSTVHLAYQEEEKIFVAVKKMDKTKLKKFPKNMERIEREIDILARIKHPNIIQFIGKFEDETSLYLVTELAAGGELFSILKRQNRVS